MQLRSATNKARLAAVCLNYFLCFSTASFAETMGSVVTTNITKDWGWVSTFTIGPDFINPGQTQTLTLLPPFQNTYTHDDSAQTLADTGAFIGLERAFNEKLSIQFGVSAYVDAQITPKGSVWQFTLPEFDDLSYAWHIHHTRVMASSKWLTSIPQYSQLHPYVSGEIGAAFNHARGYQETAREAGVLAMTPFANRNQTSFAWGVGAGFDYDVNQHVRLGLGYQFSDLGSASLGTTPAASTTQTLYLSHLYANQLRVQFTLLV